MESLFIFVRGVAMGLVLLLCLKLWLDYRQALTGRLLLAVMVGLGAYLVAPLVADFPLLLYAAVAVATSVTAFFWLYALSLFNDWDLKGISVGPLRYAVVSVYLLVSIASFALGREEHSLDPRITAPLFHITYLFRLAFVVLALAAILGQWHQDLVEARRRLRSIMTGVGGAYILVVTLAEVLLGDTAAPLLLELGHSLLLTILLLVFAVWLLLISPEGLSTSLDIPTDSGGQNRKHTQAENREGTLPITDQRWLSELRNHIEKDCGYRNSQLTIGSLGDLLSIPEHHLRRLINQHLGYRNFSEFLSHYRIAEAASRLGEPDQARLPILTIALEVGYASLTPFNRAFKAQYQQTPSEYRRQNLAP